MSPFCAFLAAGGASVQRHLEEVGIAPELVTSEELPLPLRQGCKFVENVSRKHGIPDLGLLVGSRTSVTGMGLFGKTLSQSLTLKDLLEKLIHLSPLVNTGAHIWIEDVPAAKDLRLCVRIDTDCQRAEVEAYSLMLMLDAVRIATGRNWRPKSAWLDTAAVGRASRHELLGEAQIHGVRGYAGIALPKQLLATVIQHDGDSQTTDAHLESEFRRQAPPTDLIGSVTATIRVALSSSTHSIEHSAEMLGSSARTLQRSLEGQGVSYRDLLDRVRFERARQLMREPGNRLADIAHELGYTDASNFTHAFRHWTGVSPSRYRRMQVEQECVPVGLTEAA